MLCLTVLFFIGTIMLISALHKSDPFSILTIMGLCFMLGGFLRSLRLTIFPKGDSVTITPQDFTIRQRWRKKTYEWKDVTEFCVISGFTKRQFAAFDEIAGKQHVFPTHNYRLTVDQLVKLMNHWRERALQQIC